MAVKLSEKRSELALERVLMPTTRRRTRDYAAESPMYDGTVLCRLFEVKMYRKSNIFCRMLALLNIERLNFKLTARFCSFSCEYAQARALDRASTRHMIQTANIRTSHDSNSSYQGCHMIQTAKNTGHMIQTARNTGFYPRCLHASALHRKQ